jgi:predicted transcriptional regulator
MPKLYRPPVYVSKLFGLLRFLGIEQQEVAATLKISEAQVSYWAKGKRPLPKRHWERFEWLVAERLRAACEQAETQSRPVGNTVLTRSTTFRDFCDEANRHIAAWVLEIKAVQGRLNEEIDERLRIATSYLGQDKLKLARHDRDRLEGALLDVMAGLRCVQELLDPPESRFWRYGPQGPSGETPPLAYFFFAVKLAGMW